MKFKKIITTCCMIGMLSGTLTQTALANNNEDKAFHFDFHYLNGVSQTEGRKKEDATSSYVKATELPSGGMEVRINGTHVLYQPTWYNATIRNAWLDVINQGRFIKQTVYEKGYGYAQLEGRKPNQTQDASGVWSPDSVGSYPSIKLNI